MFVLQKRFGMKFCAGFERAPILVTAAVIATFRSRVRKVDPAANGGCNWIVDEFPGVPQECPTPMKAIIVEMMREYDLT
ncbi:protein of unknown function [Burkholderia multivorans]